MSDQDPNARTGVIAMRHGSKENGGTSQLTATGVTMDQLATNLFDKGWAALLLTTPASPIGMTSS